MVIYEYEKKHLIIPEGIGNFGSDDRGGYESGYTDGINYQKSLLATTSFTQNGDYSRTNGWSNVTVDVAQTGHTDEELQEAYQSGKTDGIDEQKSLLVSTAITENGTYSRENGYNSIVVNVSGYTQQDLDNALQSGWTAGYQSGWTDGYQSGYTDGYQSGYTDGYQSGWTNGYQSGFTDGYNSGATAYYINVPSYVNFDLNGGLKSISLESNTIWHLGKDVSWITVSPTSGTGNETINISIPSYSSGRTGHISVYSYDNTIIKRIEVEQINKSFSDMYLTFEIQSGGTLDWAANASDMLRTIQYRKNGSEWTSISSYPTSVLSAETGDIIEFKGMNSVYGYGTGSGVEKYSHFSDNGLGTIKFKAYGNIMSLINGDDFVNLTSVSPYAFFHLFDTCWGLTDISNLVLPATTLADSCYSLMFYNCRNLTSIPSILPATTLAVDCYNQMFLNCFKIQNTCQLPATTLAEDCYNRMFGNCYRLTTAPELPATTLAFACYEQMFYGCSGLTTAPALPATTLATICYEQMFYGCTSLTTAPELPATTLVGGCYEGMFSGCSSLNYIKCLATDISATNCTLGWVNGVVTSSGTFVKDANMTGWTTGNNGIPYNWTVIDYEPQPSTIPLTFRITSDGIINWEASDTEFPKTIEYSKNGGSWTSITSSTGGTQISVVSGDTVQFRGDNARYGSGSTAYVSSFSGTTAGFTLEGNIMSLINSTNFSGLTTLQSASTFRLMFQDCTGLTDASNLLLPATTLKDYCYYGMFIGCTSLTNAPALPATTLAVDCYNSMFVDCSSLTTAPALPATTLKRNCYQSMFSYCTNLVNAPELPAPTLVNNCYQSMFRGCSSLNYIKCLATNISASSCTYYWVNGVSGTGTFVKDANMTGWTTAGDNGVPTGWTVIDA